MVKVKRGDLVWVNLSGAMFSEQGSDNRICVVLQNDVGNEYSPTTIIAPLTSELKKLNMPTHILLKKNEVNGIKCDSVVLCEQVRTIDKKRINSISGNVGARIMNKITWAYIANVTGENKHK